MKDKLRSRKSNLPAKAHKKIHFEKHISDEYDNMGWLHIAMVLAYFLSIAVILNGYPVVDLTLYEFFQMLCLMLAITFLIPLKLYRKKLTMSIYEYIILNFIGLTPFLCASFLLANEGMKGNNYEESYKIIHIERVEKSTVFTLENDQYQERPYLRTIYDSETFVKTGIDSLGILFSKGGLGVRIIERKRLH